MFDSLADVMKNYIYNFIPIYILLITAITTTYVGLKYKQTAKYFIGINILSFISILFNIIFLAVLVDNQAPNIRFFYIQDVAIGIIIFCLVIFQIYKIVKNNRIK